MFLPYWEELSSSVTKLLDQLELDIQKTQWIKWKIYTNGYIIRVLYVNLRITRAFTWEPCLHNYTNYIMTLILTKTQCKCLRPRGVVGSIMCFCNILISVDVPSVFSQSNTLWPRDSNCFLFLFNVSSFSVVRVLATTSLKLFQCLLWKYL